MLDIEPPTRAGGRRFVRRANAITQAEIRRLLNAHSPAGPPTTDELETVQQELRRLAASRPHAGGRRRHV